MKYSYNWLQKHIEQPLPSVEVLKEKIIFHAFEVESVESYNDDTIFDIKVLPDRAHDCLSHYGMAREIAGLYGYTLKQYSDQALPNEALAFPIEVQNEGCRRYITIEMSGVKIGSSPTWLKEALESIGARSINSVVDATNYVLFDRGQPVHAFDKEKIDGGIVVRLAHEHEQITTLSKEEKQLQPTDLVIADYLGVLAIAGVKGGMSAEVTDETKTIIIEVANFEPTPVRKTSRRLGLVTDASKRFENDLTPAYARDAAANIVALITEIAGGTITGVYDNYPHPVQERTVSFTTSEIQNLLGVSITTEDIVRVFDMYAYVYTKERDGFSLTIPFERIDIQGAHDIAEEVGRVCGYNTIHSAPLPFTPVVQPSEYDKVRATKLWLAQNGFREVMTYSFRKKGDVTIARGPKDKSALRTTLSEGLKESYELNRQNAPLIGIETIKLFEIGTVFFTDREELHVATVNGGVFEEVPIDAFIEKYSIALENTVFSVPKGGIFTEWSVYPFITRDIAVWGDTEEALKTLDGITETFSKTHCVRPPVIFDRFEKEGRISIAYRFVFQAPDKTLTDAEVSEWFSYLTTEIETIKGLEIR